VGCSDVTKNWLALLSHSDRFYQAQTTTRDFYCSRRITIEDIILGGVKGRYVTGNKAENLVLKIYCELVAYINVLRWQKRAYKMRF